MSLKRRKVVTSEEREQIIGESLKSGCVITELARTYGISADTIYGWRNKHRNKSSISKSNLNAAQTGKNASNSNNNDSNKKFLEVSVVPSKSLVLQKAELVFNEIVLTVQGSLSSTKLLNIIKLLEE